MNLKAILGIPLIALLTSCSCLEEYLHEKRGNEEYIVQDYINDNFLRNEEEDYTPAIIYTIPF